MKPPLVIDTCALRDSGFWKWLRDYHGRKVLPAVAYAELSIYFVNSKHWAQDKLDGALRSMGVDVEWYRTTEARQTVLIANMTGEFAKHARDHMIASHAYLPPWIVITHNTKDFMFIRDRVMTPGEAQRHLDI